MPYNYYSNQYMPVGYNPYYTNQIQRPQTPYQPSPPVQTLQGKIVDNIEVVKATDIMLDGSTSYFPIADGSAIVSKQLQQDGTSKIVVFKPVQTDDNQTEIKYVTQDDLKAYLGDFNIKDIKDIKDEIKSLKKQIRNITDEFEEKGSD